MEVENPARLDKTPADQEKAGGPKGGAGETETTQMHPEKLIPSGTGRGFPWERDKRRQRGKREKNRGRKAKTEEEMREGSRSPGRKGVELRQDAERVGPGAAMADDQLRGAGKPAATEEARADPRGS